MLRAGSPAVVAAALVAASTPARAGNEDSFTFGEDAALTAGAVAATSRDPAAIWYNPAGLGLNVRGRIQLSGTAFTLRDRTIPGGLALDLPSRRVEQTIESRKIYVVPAALAIARELRDGLSLGLGLFVTEQDIYNYKASLVTGDDTIELDVAGALNGTTIRYQAGASIGYQATPTLRLGATLFGVYEDDRELRKLFANATAMGAYTSTFFQRLVDTRATRYGMELLAGAQLELPGGWSVGVTARSPRLVVREDAATDNSTVLVSTGPGVATVADSTVDHAPIGVEGTGFTRPARFVAAVARQVGSLEAALEVSLRTPGVGITAERAVWNVRSGLLWHASARSALGFGLFTDRSGAAAPTTFPDARVHYYGGSAGWKRHNTLRLSSGESASTLVFSTTIAFRYALGLGESARIRFDFRETADTGLVGRIADERVDVTYHEASLYVGSGFEF